MSRLPSSGSRLMPEAWNSLQVSHGGGREPAICAAIVASQGPYILRKLQRDSPQCPQFMQQGASSSPLAFSPLPSSLGALARISLPSAKVLGCNVWTELQSQPLLIVLLSGDGLVHESVVFLVTDVESEANWKAKEQLTQSTLKGKCSASVHRERKTAPWAYTRAALQGSEALNYLPSPAWRDKFDLIFFLPILLPFNSTFLSFFLCFGSSYLLNYTLHCSELKITCSFINKILI